MGEIRGGYIRGDLPPEDRERAVQELFDHIMGGPPVKGASQTEQPPPPDPESKPGK